MPLKRLPEPIAETYERFDYRGQRLGDHDLAPPYIEGKIKADPIAYDSRPGSGRVNERRGSVLTGLGICGRNPISLKFQARDRLVLFYLYSFSLGGPGRSPL